MSKNTKLTIIALLVAIFVFVSVCGFVYKGGKETPAMKIASEFMVLLIEQDLEKAKELSTGTILANISQSKGGKDHIPKSEIVKHNMKLIYENNQISKVNMELETKLQESGIINAHWYEVHLINDKENNWRVFRIEEIEALPGKDEQVSSKDRKKVTELFNNYVLLLSENNYDKAGELLVGKAKTVHEQSREMLSRTPVISHFENIDVEPLFFDGRSLTARVGYRVDGRDAKLAVSFFRTSEGWRIYNVSQI